MLPLHSVIGLASVHPAAVHADAHASPFRIDTHSDGDPTEMAAQLWRSLQPERWPLSIDQLPAGAVLVGGAVRDGLLGRLPETPDLDFIVPGQARQCAPAGSGA